MVTEELRKIDPTGMYNWILNFSEQIEEAVAIGSTCRVKIKTAGLRNIVITGLGGSAIGGNLLRSYLQKELHLPIVINRHYVLPQFVDNNTLVIVSSYSGNTEETIAAHLHAVKRGTRVLCISTGGETERLAKKFGQPWIKIPSGLSPRAALGYSFFPLLVVFASWNLIKRRPKEIKETIDVLRQKREIFGNVASSDNAPLQLARRLVGKVPIIYSASEHFDAVGLRWRGQICENAKQLAFGHVLPELNHNELVGWKNPPQLLKQMHVVFLRDRRTHRRVAIREDITKGIVSERAAGVTEVWSEGTSLLARMFYLVHFGDWVSYYLAILNKEDPTPVRVIDYLKSELAKL
jgi:glucose/mannose-6-phosphate isomerase